MKYSLNIYGENDEIVKNYTTSIAPWGLFVRAAALQEELKDRGIAEQIHSINDLVMTLFCGLTEEELSHADINDVFNIFKQIINSGSGLKNV